MPMTRGTLPFERQTPASKNSSSAVTVLAAIFGSVLIVAFQTGFLPFFSSLFVNSAAWPPLYYGFWLCSITLALIIFATRADIRRDVAPIGIFCIVAAGLCMLHPLDGISKNLIVALALASCLAVFSLVTGVNLLTRLCASVTALNAVICLLEIFFSDGLSNAVGRAAGFGINPNVAAAGLLLGGVATYSSISRRLRISFLILVGAAIFATLSRSTLMIAGLLVASAVSISLVRRGLAVRSDKARWQIHRLDLLAFVALTCWVLTAAATNPRFAYSTTIGYAGLTDASRVFRQAIEEIEARFQIGHVEVSSVTGDSAAPASAALGELEVEAANQVETYSPSARGLLLERAYLAFQSGPLWGRGLQISHDMAPHNTFLFFAIAFGWAGLTIPLAIILLALYKVREPADFALAISITGIMIFSHDLLVPGLFIPLVTGIVRRLSKKPGLETFWAADLAVRAVTITACLLLALGIGAVMTITSATIMLDLLKLGVVNSHTYSSHIFPPYHGVVRPAYSTGSGSSTEPYEMQENGIGISNSLSPIQEVLDTGRGRFAQIKRDIVIFSASDNSDPRQNLRSYKITFPLSPHPLIALVFMATLLWCVGFVVGTRAIHAGQMSGPRH